LVLERTLVIIKPDAVQRGLIGQIIHRFERRGLRMVAMRFMQITRELAERHYAVHKGKPFYEPLVAYIVSAPVVVLVLEGKDAIQVHGSDGPETAHFEVSLFFDSAEMVSWDRELEPWISEEAGS
jgi:nucleoside-diphosphate kinase